MSCADFEKEYGDILKTGGIDIDANVKEAGAMSFSEVDLSRNLKPLEVSQTAH